MKFSEQIRVDIAARLIDVILPIILGTIVVSFLVSLVFAPGQSHRLVPPLVGGTERILFVDDEAIQIEMARESLGRMGYRVDGFSDSTAAWDHFQRNPDAYDLVITDMTMPRITGDILAKQIHLVRPRIPVVLCTGFSNIIDEDKACKLNIQAFLYKPVVARELLQTIRQVLDEGREAPPA